MMVWHVVTVPHCCGPKLWLIVLYCDQTTNYIPQVFDIKVENANVNAYINY